MNKVVNKVQSPLLARNRERERVAQREGGRRGQLPRIRVFLGGREEMGIRGKIGCAHQGKWCANLKFSI